MNTIERLKQIRAKCVELLETASRRTPGEWRAQHNHDSITGPCYQVMSVEPEGWKLAINGLGPNMGPCDATFIASCAGPAEAGWRATIGRIDNINRMRCLDLSPCDGGSCMVATNCDDRIQSLIANEESEILTAWEGIV